ncbi:hypothetical protein LCGC14_1039270 [marine sediment metagenome]|uniref:Uncharacterized protein n=1 Tax=marine sediment metagenome TaxID=412755 RepID=A0A0F9MWR7_9ZZZZ
MNARAVFDRQFAGRWFQVYAIIGDKSLTSPASFNDTHDALESFEQTGSGNGVDIREVK